MIKRITVVALVLVMCAGVFPMRAEAAYDYTSVRTILNNAALYPQKTGFRTIDQKVETMLNGFRQNASTTFDLMVAAYDWLVYNVTYDSSITYYPYYDFDSYTRSPVPFYAVYFGYDPLFMKEGVCDNFSSAFVIMARAIGLDAYLRWGKQVTSSRTYDHMWVEIKIDGVGYIFDPQSDNSVYKSQGRNRHLYFGCPAATSSMYRVQDGRLDNKKLTAAFTPTGTTLPIEYCYVNYAPTGNGTVTGNTQNQSSAQMTARSALFNSKNYSYQFSGWLEGTYVASLGAQITLRAVPDRGETFKGWYVNGQRVSTLSTYSFRASGDVTVYALFSGEKFIDVPEGKWYSGAVYFCLDHAYMTGTSDVTFSPDATLSRAMAVTVMARVAGADLSAYSGVSSYKDVQTGKWYSAAVEWARVSGLSDGYGNGCFGLNDNVTREQLAVMMWGLAEYLDMESVITNTSEDDTDLSRFSDLSGVHRWALPAIKWAYRNGIISGDDQNRLRPRGSATRAEMAVMVKRFVNG